MRWKSCANGSSDNKVQAIVDKDAIDLPLYLHFESCKTAFIHVNVFISTASIPVKLRPLMSVYYDMFFDTPIMMDGVRLEHEEVVTQIEKDTISTGISTGSYVDMPEGIRIKLQVEPEKYETAIKWLRTLLWDSIFDKKRIGITVGRMRSNIPDEKRQGKYMVTSVKNMIELAPESMGRASDTLVKSKYLKRIEALLKEDPEEVIRQFEEFRQAFVKLDNMRMLVIADLEKLKNPVSTWKLFSEGKPFSGTLSPIDKRWERLSPAGQKPGGNANIVSMPTIDNTYSVHTCSGPTTLQDPQVPALMLALAYLGATEGPLWNAARGSGLAYGVYIQRNQDAGQRSFDVYRSPDAYKAFAAVRKVLQGYADGTTEFDDNALEGAISGVILRFVDHEPNMTGAGVASFIRQVVHGIPKDYNKEMLRKVKMVTKDDIRKVLKEDVLRLFDPKSSNVVVVTAPVKADVSAPGN